MGFVPLLFLKFNNEGVGGPRWIVSNFNSRSKYVFHNSSVLVKTLQRICGALFCLDLEKQLNIAKC